MICSHKNCFDCPYPDCINDQNEAYTAQYKYAKTEKGKATQQKYKQSEKGKANMQKHNRSERHREAQRRYYARKKELLANG